MKRKRDTFNFVAYMSPPPANARGDGKIEGEGNENYQNEEHYGNVKKCGFNGLITIYEYDEPEFLNGLQLCDKLGLEYMVREKFILSKIIEDPNKSGKTSEALLDEKSEDLALIFDKYEKHSSFSGVLATDEPHMGKFHSIKVTQDWFEKKYPGYEFIVNLLPDYASGEQLTGIVDAEKDYQKHVDEFAKIVKPKIISYDFYALMFDKDTKKCYIAKTYLKNLEVIAKKVKEINAEFRVFLQTLGFFNYRTVTTYREIAWQVYTAMAYGATGAQTFTYWTMLGHPIGNPEHVTSALVGVDGELLPSWYAMQETISEVRAFEKEYCSFDWEKCLYYLGDETKPNPLVANLDKNNDDDIIDVRTTADILVGCFRKENKKAYLFSNLTDPDEDLNAEIKINFTDEHVAIIYKGGEMKKTSTAEKVLSLSLRSGEGVFIVLD